MKLTLSAKTIKLRWRAEKKLRWKRKQLELQYRKALFVKSGRDLTRAERAIKKEWFKLVSLIAEHLPVKLTTKTYHYGGIFKCQN